MKTIKTSDLIGRQLDFAVAKCEGLNPMWKRTWLTTLDPWWATNPNMRDDIVHVYPDNVRSSSIREYSTDWTHGGPIIDGIGGLQLKIWLESEPDTKCEVHIHNYEGNWIEFGPTPLIAAMRCRVASVLGDEVEIPEELL